nr:PREDICTED: transmembrane and coiled-coil domain-containing protein 1-like [Equus przewalskii]
MSTMFADTLLIVFISVCTALLAEGITWVLVYRTDKYKRLKAEVEKQSKKLEKKKETITESAGRQQKKKIGVDFLPILHCPLTEEKLIYF